jgi:molecular chaperone DnaK
LDAASQLGSADRDPEATKQALDDVHKAKNLMAMAREDHLPAIRQIELDRLIEVFDSYIRELGRPTEVSAFDNLVKTALRLIGIRNSDFESHMEELRGRNFAILWRQDWFVIDRFKKLAEDSHLFANPNEHAEMTREGEAALASNDIDRLRTAVMRMESVRIGAIREDEVLASANIVRA